jgi:hypothetical protein
LPETEASQYFNSVPTIMLNRYTVLLKWKRKVDI